MKRGCDPAVLLRSVLVTGISVPPSVVTAEQVRERAQVVPGGLWRQIGDVWAWLWSCVK